MDRQHILFVLDFFPPHKGGVETVFDNITLRLLKKGYKITVLTSHYSPKLKKYEKHGDLEIYRVGKCRKCYMRSAFRTGIKVLKQNKDISIIHTSTYGGAIPASLLAKIFKKKIILTVHEIFGKLRNLYKGRFKGFFYRAFENIVFTLPYDKYHCVSRYTMNSLRIAFDIPDEKLQVIRNGVDTDFRNPKNIDPQKATERKKKYGRENRFLLVYSGHSGKSKGLEFLINAVPDLVKNNPDIMIVFNLIDARRDSITRHQILEIEDKFNKTGNKEFVTILNGFSKEKLREFTACADAVVAPSLSEGFGSIHTETVALGKPLITTFVGPLPEVLRGKVKFIKPQSSEAIVQAVKEVRAGNITEIPTKVFSRDKTVEQIEKLYSKT